MPAKPSRQRAAAARPPATRDGDTEQRILDAAHAVFLRRGTAGARMLEIAKEADVNQALLHYYFRSKERLAEAVFRRVALKLLPPAIAILAADAPLEDKIARVVHHYIDALSAAPFLPGYIIAELTHHPERGAQLFTSMTGFAPETIAHRVLGVLGKQITERVKAGTMRPIAPEQFMINLLSLCIFPFAARPLLAMVFGLDDASWARLMKKRRAELPAFVLGALEP